MRRVRIPAQACRQQLRDILRRHEPDIIQPPKGIANQKSLASQKLRPNRAAPLPDGVDGTGAGYVRDSPDRLGSVAKPPEGAVDVLLLQRSTARRILLFVTRTLTPSRCRVCSPSCRAARRLRRPPTTPPASPYDPDSIGRYDAAAGGDQRLAEGDIDLADRRRRRLQHQRHSRATAPCIAAIFRHRDRQQPRLPEREFTARPDQIDSIATCTGYSGQSLLDGRSGIRSWRHGCSDHRPRIPSPSCSTT